MTCGRSQNFLAASRVDEEDPGSLCCCYQTETCLTLELRPSTENGDLRLAVPGTAVKRSLVIVIPHNDPLSKR